jgi:DGQHR domain-containing protein
MKPKSSIAPKKKKKKVPSTPEQKKQLAVERKRKASERKFKTDINTVFKNAGFTQIPTRDKEFDFKGSPGELDSIFVYENILVLSEDTCAESRYIPDHLRKKSLYYKLILDNAKEFIQILSSIFPEFNEYSRRNNKFEAIDYKIKFLYCTRNTLEDKHKHPHTHILFFDYPYLRYFLSLAKTIQKSSKYELFKFLKLDANSIGTNIGKKTISVDGFILPESPSGYPTKHTVASFYIDPQTLLELSYVLRKDGSWRDEEGLYQRLIIKSKIKGMRQYLATEKRVFVNNIIATLPENTKILNADDDTIDATKVDPTKATSVKIQLPYEFNTLGIIDGQHRIFAYHEGYDQLEESIAGKRVKQHLLITGIIYPPGYSKEKKLQFEAKLFLEINEKQSRVKADLKQEIEMLVTPFGHIAISKAIISNLSRKGPLVDLLEVHFFDEGKIKTSSIVSYGLKHLVKLSPTGPLYMMWKNPNKEELLKKHNRELLKDYTAFCTDELIKLFSGYRRVLSDKHLFTLDKKVSRALSATAINGVIYCLRKLIESKHRTESHDAYLKSFQKLKIDYSAKGFKYKSSHWKDLGDEIYSQCFS